MPVLFFHAAPGSSYIHADMAGAAAQRGVRLIAVERPGYGLSDPHAGRTFLSWADDIAALTDLLVELGRALVPGVTTGLPAMVGDLYALAQSNPDDLRNTFADLAPSAAALLAVVTASVGGVDKIVMNERAVECELDYTQALLCGVEGIASNYMLFSGDWGFPLEGISTELLLWSGTADQNTPHAMACSLAEQLPSSSILMLPDEGHWALYMHWDEILKKLV